MSVTNAAIGADQVQAGLDGLPQFTGAGVGIALIDSGVWTGHRSLAGRVVFSKDFVGDRPKPSRAEPHSQDPYGHGTHIGATIAGNSPYPRTPTWQTAVPRRRARRPPHQPARHRRRRHGQGQRRDRRHRLGHPGTASASTSASSICRWAAGRSSRIATTRCARRSSARCTRASSSWWRRAIAAKTTKGRSVYGLIESPGIDPYVITVGATQHERHGGAVG